MKLRLDSGVRGILDWKYISFPSIMKKVKGANQVYSLPLKDSKGELIQIYTLENSKSLVTCLRHDGYNYPLTRIFIYDENQDGIEQTAGMILKVAKKEHTGFLYRGE